MHPILKQFSTPFVLLAIVWISSTALHPVMAQEFAKYNTLDSFMHYVYDNDRAMFSVSIWEGDKEKYNNTVGYADIAKGRKADAATTYHIGSISKMFTSVMIMKAIEEGKLSLDSKLSAYFPRFDHADHITIRMMLNHTSGIANFTDSEAFATYMEKEVGKEDMLVNIDTLGFNFEPGTSYAYSNSNYVLLTYILESLYQLDYDDILQEKICKPCSLKDVHLAGVKGASANNASSYYWSGSWKAASKSKSSVSLGAGGIVAPTAQVSKFLRCLFNDQLLQKSTLVEMMPKTQDSYGLGIAAAPYYRQKVFGHTGGIDGFQSVSYFFPDKDMTVSVNINALRISRNELLLSIMNIYEGRPFDFPKYTDYKVVEISLEELTPLVGVYKTDAFPLDINVFLEGDVFMAQATGQGAFPLTHIGDRVFVFEDAGIEMTFDSEKSSMQLKQYGNVIEFLK